ncbi:MAG: hypothetical protein J6J12_10035 [Oscillospiraceae bacterium]|nr:hypothetical protein [Oscillospiraceae bacterium]
MENEDYIEIDLKSVFFRVLYQWKQIFAAMLVAALLLGSLQAFLASQPAETASDRWSDQETYAHELALRQDRVTAVLDKINTLQEYIDNAVLMKADHRKVYMARATYYIDTGYQIKPENVYQDTDKTSTLVWYYWNYLQDRSVYDALSEEIGVDANYLMDLVTVERVNGNTLSLSVWHPARRSAEQIMEALQRTLGEICQNLEETVTPHTMTLMQDTCGVYMDENLKKQQQSVNADMIAYNQELIQVQNELEAFLKTDVPSQASILKTFLKWAILGGIGAGGLLAVYYALQGILGSRIYSAEAIAERYGLPVLGQICCKSPSDPLTRCFMKWEGRLTENSPANDLLLAATVKLHCHRDTLLLYSDCGIDSSRQVLQQLQPHLSSTALVPYGCLTSEAEALVSLERDGDAILVITGGVSRKKAVESTRKLLLAANKPIAGILFLECC